MATSHTSRIFSAPVMRKPQKVRNSCNACSAQKVRCGKERPTCVRCAIKGIDCKYSMSRRTGERPRVEPLLSPQEAIGVEVSSDRRSLGPGIQAAIAANVPTEIPDFSMLTPSNTHDDFDDWIRDLSAPGTESQDLADGPHCDSDMYNDGLEGQRDLSVSSGSQESTITSASDNALISPFASELLEGGIGLGAEASQQQREQWRRPSPQIEANGRHQQPSTAYQDRSDTAIQNFEPESDLHQQSRGNTFKEHDCTAKGLQILHDFHLADLDCHRAGGPRIADCVRNSGQTEEVEVVLGRTREAWEQLNHILHCACSSQVDVLIIVHLAISKVVQWLSAILGAEKQANPQVQAIREHIAVKPVSMGRIHLDEQARSMIMAHVVLNELHDQIYPVIRKLLSRRPAALPDVSAGPRGDKVAESRRTDAGGEALIHAYQTVLLSHIKQVAMRARATKHGEQLTSAHDERGSVGPREHARWVVRPEVHSLTMA